MKLSRHIRFGLGTFFFTMTPMAGANPTGAEVAIGSAAFDAAGSALSITTATDRTVINWNSFSIGTGQITSFIQPNASSAVLNRVIGSMPSEIAGQLVSNGRVGLLNPNGILITQAGSINTNGFTASTLNLSDDDFMGSGILTFKGDSEAVVSNSGTILARQGDVFLIGRTVANSGTIEARDGNVALAAGSEITLQKAGDGRMSVTVPASSKKGSVSHSGTIKAVQQQLRDNGGNPYVLGMNVDSGAEMSPQDFMNAQVAINAGRGRAEVSGTVAAGTQAKGGEVQVAGGEVAVKAGARLDVSGDRSGGTIQVGGGFQGQDSSITNSRTTTVESGSTFTADSRIAGDGGQVILWSDGATTFGGSISAQGGANGGNGGLVEVSGKQWLSFRGDVVTLAVHGNKGMLLLDPANITIQAAAPDINGDAVPGDDIVAVTDLDQVTDFPGASSVITNGALVGLLAGNDVTLAASNTITVAAPVAWNSAFGLSLNAGGQIAVNAPVTNLGTGGIALVGNGGIALGANVATGGGLTMTTVNSAINQTAGSLAVTGISSIGAGTGNITLTSATNNFAGAVSLSGAVTQVTDSGALTLGTLATGNLTVAANGLLNLGTGTVTGALVAGSNGSLITQAAGGLTVTGGTALTAGAGAIGLTDPANNFATVTIASGNVVTLVDSNALELGDVTAASLTTHSGAGGSGDTTFAGGSTINADSQSYRAGNGFGGGTTAKVITSTGDFGNTAGTDSPATFIHWQDASIANADITSLSKFVGTVPAAYTLRSDDGSITITNAGKIDGSNLILDARTDLTISDAPTLTSLDATAGTTITLSADVTSSGPQFYRSSLTLAGDTELQGTVVTTEGVVIGAGNDLTITGNAVFGNAGADTLTGLGALEVTGLTTLNASAVTTTAGQIYGGTVTLGAGTALTGTSLALAAGGIVGAGNDLAVDFSTAITLPGNIAGVGNFTSQKAVKVNGSFTTSGSQTYNAAVTLTGNSSLTGTALTLATGITGAGNNLILDFSTPVTLPGNLTGIGNFTSQNAVNVNGSFATSGSQTYNAAVTLIGHSSLTGTALTLATGITGGGNNLILDFSTPFTLTGNIAGVGNFTSQKAANVNGSFTTSGSQTYNSAVTLTGDSSLTGTAITLAAGGIVGAGNNLILDFSTPITLPDNIAGVGNFIAQQAVNVDGSFTTSGSQTYNAAVTLTGPSTLAGTALTLAAGIVGGGNNLTLDFSTPFVLPGSITGVQNFISEKAILLNGSFTTTGSQRYKGAVETGLASTLAGSSVRFDNRLSVAGDSTAGSLTIAGDLILAPTSTLYLTLGGTAAGTFDQIVVTGAGNDVTVTNATLDGEAAHSYSVGNEVTIIAKPAGNVIGTFASGGTASIGGQGFEVDYADSPPTKNITLTRAVSTWTWDGGDNSGIDNLWSLKKNWGNQGVPASGDIVVFDQNDDSEQFNNLVGLDLDRIIFMAGADSFKLTGNAVTLANGIVNDSNNLQTVALPITLAGNQAFITTGTGALVVGDALAAVSGAVDLALSGSNRITLGGATTLNSLTANSPTGLGDVTVTTSAAGGQVYNGAVTLVGNTVLNAGAGAITFAGTVNGGFSLAANTTGVTTFGGTVGNGTALTSLVTNAGGTTAINGGLIRTSAAGGQVFNDVVTLGADAELDAGAGAVTFIDTLNGLFGLTVNTTGATTFGTVVGGTDRLTGLTTNAGGTVVFNGALVRTSGPQSYGDAVVTGLAMTLDSGAGSITAVNPLNDFPQPLTLTGGIVQVTDANGLTLGTLATGNLTATATGALSLGTGTVTGALSATSNGGPISQAAGGLTITGISTVNAGAGTITLTDPNNDFQGAVSLTGSASQIVDKNALRFGAGNVASLAATAGGSVDQTGALTVTGVTTVEVTAPGSDILLHTAANDFGGAVSVIGTQTNVRDFGIRNINAGATIPALTGLTGLRNLFIEFNNIGVTLPAINASGNATIISGGAITDTGAISVGGTASFTGTAVNLGAGLFNVGTLTFSSAGNVTIVEDSTMNIVGVNTAGLTTLTSAAGISDAGATSVNVGALIVSAPSIALGGGIFNATSVNFSSPGAVVIAEDSGMDLVGINTADSATLSATGSLSDFGATSVAIAGLGSFNGGSITLGGGTFNVGTLTFNSAGAVTISEDSAMDLAGVNTGGLTTLTSAIGIFDAGATSVTMDDLVVNAPVVSLGGGILNANTVNFNSAGAVVIAEDSGMNLVGVNTAGIANLSSAGLLSDAGATSITVVGLGSFNGGSINLGGGTFNVGTLTFSSAGNVVISEDSAMNLFGANTAGSANLGSTGVLTDALATSVTVTGLGSFSGTSVILGGGVFNVGTLNFNSAGQVTIAEDSDTELAGSNAAGDLLLTSAGAITDATNTVLLVTNGSSMIANGGPITLNNAAGDTLTVGANASFTGPAITLGAAGTADFGTLTFNSAGAVAISEDSAMDLLGANTAGSATLSATGPLSDALAASVTVTGLGNFSGSMITLGGGLFNVGTLTFNSAGNVTIAEDSTMNIVGDNTAGPATLTSTVGISDAGATSLNLGALIVSAPSIALGGGIFNAASVNFNSAGEVVISEDSGMDLVGVNTADSATLSATGSLSDAGAISIAITGPGSFNGGSISLGGGTFNAGTLTFNSAGTVTISEDSAMDIAGVNTGDLTTLTSTVGISDAGATSVTVGGLVVNAPAINLGGGILNAGTVNFNSAGGVVISEDSGMDIVGANTAVSATLSSAGLLSDAGATSISITGPGSFNGGSISLGGGTFNVGTLTFNSAGNVIISEDSAMDLVGANTAGSATLSSTGILSDAGATSVTVTGLGDFSGSMITLGGGTFNVGTLSFNSIGQVTIHEDSATELAGSSTAGDLLLTSTGAITDSVNTSVVVANGSAMIANGGPITLNETAGDVLTIGVNASFTGPAITIGTAGTANFGTLNFNSTGAVAISEDSGMDLVGINTADSATLSATGALSDALAASVTVTGLGNFSGSTITLGGGIFNVGTLTFNSAGNVTVVEDSDTALAGSSTAGDLQLTSSGAIADATGTSLVVTNGSVMTASGGPITLNDTAGDVLTVGANARFTGPALTIGPAGTVNFGTLTFNSAGLVEVQEDSDTELIGFNTANRLVLGSSGALTDAAGTTLAVTTDSAISATGPVTLANTAGDILTAGTNASFAGSAVNVGISGAANFGTLSFHSAGNVVVLESSGMLVAGSSQAGTLRLESSAGAAGTIGFAGTADPGGPAAVTVGGPITLLASGGISHFAGSAVNTTGTFESETATGNITMADGSSITATQDIRLNSPGNITLGSVTTAGNARIVAAGDIIDAQADTVGHDARSFATLIGTRTVNVTGAGAYLEAGGRIGATDDNPLDVNVAALATRSTGDTSILASGDISLRQVGTTVQRLDLSSAPTPLAESSSATVAAQSTAGDVRIETISGSLSADLPANARQDLLLLANGTGANLLLNSNLTADDDIGLRAANSVTSGAVTIHATGVTAVVPNGGTIDIEAFNGNVNLISGSTVSTVNGHIRVAAESIGGVVSVANLTGPDLVVLMGDGDVNANAVTGIGLYAESRTGSINLTTHVDELAARAPGSITIHELDGLSIGLTGGDRKVDRVSLDNGASEVSALVSLGSGIGIDSATGSLNLTTGGTLSQTAIIRVNQGLVTLDSGPANDIRLTLPNEMNRLTVTNALNVAIKDIDSGDADGPSYGLMLEGINTFTGSGFAVATEGGMRFVPGTRINGPANSKVVLIAGSAAGMPGINEISGNKQPTEDESLVDLDPDLDVVGSDIYLIGNSLQSNSAPKGGYIRLINGVPADPIVNLKFNFSLAPAGPQSADGILNDAINGGTFGGPATFGMLAGLIGDTAALFSGAPVIDLSVSDASELARGLLKKGVATTNLMGNVNSLIDRGAVAPPGVSFVYFGPFWTIGYDYDQYVNKRGDLPPPLFPLYYYFDQNGKPVYLLNLSASPDVSQPVTPQ